MLTSIGRKWDINWAIIPASKAGPAFIAGGVLWAISTIVGFLVTPYVVSPLVATAVATKNVLQQPEYNWVGKIDMYDILEFLFFFCRILCVH